MNQGTQQSANRLYSLLAYGFIDPGSKRLSLDLDKHNPVEAVHYLANDKVAMSTALHELTHFHSLTNDVGTVLTARGFLGALALEDLRLRIEQKKPDLLDSVRRYLLVYGNYVSMLATWQPFLEGLAIFAQTSYPCVNSNKQIMAVDNIVGLGSTLYALNPTPLPQRILNFDDTSMGLQSAANQSMMNGPHIPVDDTYTLAGTLELQNTDWSLPYFLGHSYIRGLQARLQKILPEFVCPEAFLELMLHIMQRSGKFLLGCDELWDQLESIGRLYGWIEIFEKAPAERIQILSQLDQSVDPLTWLRDGRQIVTRETSTHDLPELLEQTIPTEWEHFKDLEEISLGLAGVVMETFTMNLTSGGRCQVAGWIPNAFDDAHYIALQTSDQTWWLAVDDANLAALQLNENMIPILAREAFHGYGGPDIPSRAQELNVASFLTQLRVYSLPLAPDPSNPSNWNFLFEFSNPADPQSTLLTEVVPGPPTKHRAILKPVTQRVKDLHDAGGRLRESMTAAFPGLNSLARWLHSEGHSDWADLFRKASDIERDMWSQRRNLWSARILDGLLGHEQGSQVGQIIREKHLNSILIDIPHIRDILTNAYSRPCKMSGPGAMDTEIVLEYINKKAISSLQKPLFELNDPRGIRYLGLWDR